MANTLDSSLVEQIINIAAGETYAMLNIGCTELAHVGHVYDLDSLADLFELDLAEADIDERRLAEKNDTQDARELAIVEFPEVLIS